MCGIRSEDDALLGGPGRVCQRLSLDILPGRRQTLQLVPMPKQDKL